MTRLFNHVAAALAAILICTVTLVPVVSVPPAQAATVPVATAMLA